MIWLEEYGLGSLPSSYHRPPSTWRIDAHESEGADLSGRSVLLVEDEMILAAEIEHSLEEAGAQVIGPVGRLGDALAIVTTSDERFDAAILDVDLHGQDVFPVADVLRDRGIPFLFHTAHGSKAGLKDRYSGAVVCNKPVFSEHLVALVAGLLE